MKNAAQWDAEVVERLKELGLTEYDTKVYLTLVARSPLAATDISREADVPMSKIYGVLGRLETGGWISVVPERPKQYRAVDPGVTIDNACKQAVGRLESSKSMLLKNLKDTYDNRSDVEASEFLVVHGTVNVLNHLKEILQLQKTGVTIAAAFVNVAVLGRFHDLINAYEGPKRLYIINDPEGLKQFAAITEHVPYASLLNVDRKWHEGVFFVYTQDTGVYANVEGDEFKMALIIRDRGFLDLIKMFVGMAHSNTIHLDHAGSDSHKEMLHAHTAKAKETFDKLLSKHK